MNTLKQNVPLALIAVIGLSACGGSGGDPMTQQPDFSAVDADGNAVTLVDLVEGGAEFTASGPQVAALALDYEGDTTSPTDATVILSRNATGDLTATINGIETVFTPSEKFVEQDGRAFGYQREVDGAGNVYVFSQTGEISEILEDGTDFSGVISYYQGSTDGQDTRAYAAFGAQTPYDVAPSGNAEYNGFFRVDTVPANDFEGFRANRTTLRGDVTMTVDMAGSISGELDNLQFGEDRLVLEGAITMGSSEISESSFSGDLTADATLFANENANLSDAALGTYNGRLYGPDADEATGVLNLGIQSEDAGNQNGVGFFKTFLND